MKPSRYLERLKDKNLLEYLEIPGDGLLVERIPPEEVKTKTGLILPVDGEFKQINTYKQDLPTFVHVLVTGAGFYDDQTKEDKPLDTKPGDILLVPMTSIKWFSNFFEIDDYKPYDIGFMYEGEKQLRVKTYASYEKIRQLFNPETDK